MIVWFRGHDLRLADHAALRHALGRGEAIPLFVLDPNHLAPRRARAAAHRTQFFLESLVALQGSIRARGSDLLVLEGPSRDVVPALADELRSEVVALRSVAPRGRARDEAIARRLGSRFRLEGGQTLAPPESIRTRDGRPYAVYSRFAARFHEEIEIGRPLPTPRHMPPLPSRLRARSVSIPTLASLGVDRNPRLPRGGEQAARERLRRFVRGPAARYDRERDRLDSEGTSRLSADLKFGTLSPRQVLHAVMDVLEGTEAARSFERELVFREFAHATLWDRPDVLERPFQSKFEGFPYLDDAAAWAAWVAGETGYPVVDAAARQLLGEGFVHNRARMISASFLTKHLLVDFRRGEDHYFRELVDGDLANNDAGWQWCAGSGSDAQPYFRIFNPITQGKTHDPEGSYVRRFVPELAELPARFIHAPWEAPSAALADAGIELGRTYPRPIVDHKTARARYLAIARAHLGRSAAQRR